MRSFTDYIQEAKLPAPSPVKQKSFNDVQDALGKGKTNAMLKHKWMSDYSMYEKAYKHGVDNANFHHVEVYPYMPSLHTTPEGKVRPNIMLRFHFADSNKVAQVHKFIRDKDPSSDWKHAKSWKQDDVREHVSWGVGGESYLNNLRRQLSEDNPLSGKTEVVGEFIVKNGIYQ